jgi:serine/threonine-protein kinase RIO1
MTIHLSKLKESSVFKMIMPKVLMIKFYRLNLDTSKNREKMNIKKKLFKGILSKNNNKI